MGMSTGLRNVVLDSGYDAWANAHNLIFKVGAQPADADQAPIGAVLATIVIPADGFSAAALGIKAKLGTWSVAASAAGTIGHARMQQTTDLGTTNITDERHDFTVGIAGPNLAITAASIVGGQAQFTTAAHSLADGDMVEITGHNAAYNRKWIINTITATTFRVPSMAAVNGANGNARKSFEITVDNTVIAAAQVITVNSLDIII